MRLLVYMFLVAVSVRSIPKKDVMIPNWKPIPPTHTCIAVSPHKERRMCLIAHTYTHTAGCWSV